MTVSREAQQVDDFEQVWRHHRNTQVKEPIAEADRTFQAIQNLFCYPGTTLSCRVVVGLIRNQRPLLVGGSSPAGFLQLADVAVAFVVHFPGLTEDPASFDVC